jgi:hypothetical protein
MRHREKQESQSSAATALRRMRSERRELLRRIADAESRAKEAERARDDILADKSSIYDQGTELWQNVWDKNNVSQTLKFPTNKSVMCSSAEEAGGNCMPGVHSLGSINNGKTTQSIWIKGAGYTLVGLVSTEVEKHHIRKGAGDHWDKLPMMEIIHTETCNQDEGEVCTLEIDMIERRAELYHSKKSSTQQLRPVRVWTDLSDEVWVAVAFKRNSGREAVLMPCIHWRMQAMSSTA